LCLLHGENTVSHPLRRKSEMRISSSEFGEIDPEAGIYAKLSEILVLLALLQHIHYISFTKIQSNAQ